LVQDFGQVLIGLVVIELHLAIANAFSERLPQGRLVGGPAADLVGIDLTLGHGYLLLD